MLRTLAVAPAGDRGYVGGQVGGTGARFGSFSVPAVRGLADGFIGQLDGAGSWQWLHAYGGAHPMATVDDVVAGIVVDSTGGAIIAGTFLGTMFLNGAPVTSK